MRKEMYVYVLDETTMFIVARMFAVWYPGKTLKDYNKMDDCVDAATGLHNCPVAKDTGRNFGV
jgi:hypothetical protein